MTDKLYFVILLIAVIASICLEARIFYRVYAEFDLSGVFLIPANTIGIVIGICLLLEERP